jgi:hypothetical protein
MLTIMGVCYGYVFFKFLRSSSFHIIIIVYALSYLSFYMGVLSYMLHLIVYGFDGYGLNFLSFLGTFLKGLSEIILIQLLLFMSAGWTITYQNLRHKIVIFLFPMIYVLFFIVLFVWSQLGIKYVS